jgi:hypothetical protein
VHGARRASAPGVGVVDEIVVHERGGVEHLEAAAAEITAVRGPVARAPPATDCQPVTQKRARSRLPPSSTDAAA